MGPPSTREVLLVHGLFIAHASGLHRQLCATRLCSRSGLFIEAL